MKKYPLQKCVYIYMMNIEIKQFESRYSKIRIKHQWPRSIKQLQINMPKEQRNLANPWKRKREKETNLVTEWRVEAMEIVGDLQLRKGLLEDDDGNVITEPSLRRAIFCLSFFFFYFFFFLGNIFLFKSMNLRNVCENPTKENGVPQRHTRKRGERERERERGANICLLGEGERGKERKLTLKRPDFQQATGF